MALTMLVLLPFIGFYLGISYHRSLFPNPLPTEVKKEPVSTSSNQTSTTTKETSTYKLSASSLPKVSKIDENTPGYATHRIPNTELAVTMPATFVETEEVMARMQTPVSPVITFVKTLSTWGQQGNNHKEVHVAVDEAIAIYVQETNLSPEEWLSENVTFQGSRFDPSITDICTTKIGGRDVYITYTSCCGGYTPTYMLEDVGTDGEQILVILTTNAKLWAKPNKLEGNYLLDYLVGQIEEI